MPEWLLKKDEYIPKKEKDAFINKSILSILAMLTRLRLQTENKANKFGVSAPVKVITTLLIAILTSMSRSVPFVITVDVFLLLAVSMLDVKEIKYIMKIVFLTSVFTFIVLVPSILMGNKDNSFLILIKVMASITAVNITACTTKWNDIVAALKIFLVPDIFIFVLDIAIKYIVIFGEFSLNMLYCLKLRSVGKSKNKSATLSGIIGNLFLKSKEMSEEMYGAMECRGFTGEYKVYRKTKITTNDVVCIAANVVLLCLYIFL